MRSRFIQTLAGRLMLPATSWVVGMAFAFGLWGCGKVSQLKGIEKRSSGEQPGGPIIAEGEADSLGNNGRSLDAGSDLCTHAGRAQNLKVDMVGFTKATWARASGPGMCAFSNPDGMETRVTCDTQGEHRLTVTVLSNDGKSLSDSVILNVLPDPGAGGLDACVGKVRTMLGQVDDSPMAVAVQGDGKVIVAGYSHSGKDRDFAAVRYNPDGSVDRTFAKEGKLNEDIAGMDTVKDIKILPDGKILMAGESASGTGNLAFTLARYEANGKPDLAFNVSGKQGTAFPFGSAYGNALLVQPDGKMLVGGEVYNTNQQFDCGIVRVLPSGELDSTFGNAGRVIADLSGSQDGIHAMALQKDGKIVTVGYGFDTGFYHFVAARFNADGSLDASFGSGGSVIVRNGNSHSTAHAVGVQSDGKIVVVGDYTNGATRDLAIVRLTVDGVVDPTFGIGGRVLVGLGATAEGRQGVLIQGDDKIVAVGYGAAANSTAFVAIRLNSNGSMDSGFAQGGMTLIDFGAGPDLARAAALDPKGDIIVAGSTGSPSAFGWLRIFR